MPMNSGYPEKVIDKGGIDGTGITLLRKPYNRRITMYTQNYGDYDEHPLDGPHPTD